MIQTEMMQQSKSTVTPKENSQAATTDSETPISLPLAWRKVVNMRSQQDAAKAKKKIQEAVPRFKCGRVIGNGAFGKFLVGYNCSHQVFFFYV